MERFAWPKNLSSRGKQEIKELLDGQNPTKKIRHLFDAHSQTGNNTAQPLFGEDLIVSFLGSFSYTLSPSSSAADSYEVSQVPTNACVRSEVSEGSESIKPPGNNTAQPLFGEDLIVSVLGSFSNTLSSSSSAAESYEVSQVPTNACVRSEVSEGSESINTPVPRRRTSDTWTGLDLNLIDNRHQWSTYDQQSIPNFELPERNSDSGTNLDQNLTAWRTYDQQSILNSPFPRYFKRPARTLKRPRLVWTPQLHKRFVDAVAHLGIKNAVPKTIMQLMSVDGLTREDMASHLQKYRLYLKRMLGLSVGGGGLAASSDPASDHLFASSPVPPRILHQVRPSSDHFLPFVPVDALPHHQMAATAGHPQLQPQYHRQVGHFGEPQNGQFEHPFLSRQAPPVHRMGAPMHNPVQPYVEDLESADANGGRKVLTLFPELGN